MDGSAIGVPRYVAFLRAINVGGHTVKMEHLRKLVASLGYMNVETFIASGNVIFYAPARSTRDMEKEIERHLQESLGYAVATFIRTHGELAVIARYQPFPAPELEEAGNALYIAFLPTPPSDEAQDTLMASRTETDDFHIHGRETYWLCRTRISDSTFSGAKLEKILGMPATMRNVTTVRKLAAKYPLS
jgi:uncharacterized protein (DUF1697 family)